MKHALPFLMLALLAGCSTAHKLNRLSLGMTKAEVLRAMGTPHESAAADGVETFTYQKYATSEDAWYGARTPYLVVFKDGKVVKYGKKDDLLGPPTKRVIIENRGTAATPAVTVD